MSVDATPVISDRTIPMSAVDVRSRRLRSFAIRHPRWTKAGQVLLSFAVLVTVWDLAVRLLDIPSYVLPAPWEVVKAFVQGMLIIPITQGPLSAQGFILPLMETLSVVLMGFVFGSGLALIIGLLMSWFRVIDNLLMPIITAIQSLPKIALGPLFILWFGFGQLSKVLLCMLLVFFPVLVNTRSGMNSISEDRMMMARSFNASPLRQQWLIKLPTAVPYIFTGLEIAAVYALLGAVLSEFLGGSSGLGVRILQYQYLQALAPMFAVLLLLGILGATLYGIIGGLRKRIIFWERK